MVRKIWLALGQSGNAGSLPLIIPEMPNPLFRPSVICSHFYTTLDLEEITPVNSNTYPLSYAHAPYLTHTHPISRTRPLSHAHPPYLTHTLPSHAHAPYLTQTPAISSTRPLSHAHGRKTLHVNKYKATRTQNCTCLHFASGFRKGCNVFIF